MEGDLGDLVVLNLDDFDDCGLLLDIERRMCPANKSKSKQLSGFSQI